MAHLTSPACERILLLLSSRRMEGATSPGCVEHKVGGVETLARATRTAAFCGLSGS